MISFKKDMGITSAWLKGLDLRFWAYPTKCQEFPNVDKVYQNNLENFDILFIWMKKI